jgi:hypothetical protein
MSRPEPESEESAYFMADEVSRLSNRWFQHLSGKIMTVIDASLPSGPQCKAAKDLASQAIWQVYNEMWDEMSRKASVK